MHPAIAKYAPLLLAIPILAMTAGSTQAADYDSLCPPGVHRQPDGDVTVWQHRFEDGTFDLAIARSAARSAAETGTPVRITRLSFKGGKEPVCHFPAFSLLRGGDWGWHVAWSSTARPGLYYARVDGEAWVSSVPKKISGNISAIVGFRDEGDRLVLKYQELSADARHSPASRPEPVVATELTPDPAVTITLVSTDEGRNWEMLPAK